MVSIRMEEKLAATRILAVLSIEDAEHAVPVGRALVRGGITGIELTLRTAAAYECIRRIKKEVPQISLGVGTVLRADQCFDVSRLGAEFALSPGLNPRVVQAAHEAGLPFIPGIATPSELEQAVELGCRVLKLFPSESLGGASYLQRLNEPYAFLDLKYIPLGGINESNARSYLEVPSVVAVGGSWIAPRELVRNERWDEIAQNAERARKIAVQEEAGY